MLQCCQRPQLANAPGGSSWRGARQLRRRAVAPPRAVAAQRLAVSQAFEEYILDLQKRIIKVGEGAGWVARQ